MANDDQQDFDEFDNLVEDSAGGDEAFDTPPMKPKKKSSGILIVVLMAVIGIAAGAVWFLFLNPGAVPLPSPAVETPAPQQQADASLPPGVSTGTEQPASATPADQSTSSEQAGIVPPPTEQPGTSAAPTPTTEEKPAADTSAPAEGTTAEALPPPAAPGTETATSAASETTTSAPTAETPSAPVAETTAAPIAQDATITAQLPTPTVEAPAETPVDNKDIGVAPTEQPPAEAMPTPIAETATPAGAPTQIDAASAERLNKIEQQLQDLTGELSTVKSAAPAAASTSGADPELNQKLDALTAKLDDLTKQVSALDERTTQLATEMQNRPVTDEPKAAQPAADEAPAAAETIKPVEAKKPAPKKKAPVKKPAAKPVSSTGWELRSAQPGVAWLGRVGSGEMSRYAVGQTVPGLGTIQSVGQEGGRWVVKTTGGTVRE